MNKTSVSRNVFERGGWVPNQATLPRHWIFVHHGKSQAQFWRCNP